MKNFFAMFAADYYKIGHAIKMQPQGAESFEQIRARLRAEEEIDKGRDQKW